ncbi:MAG TPA: LLM class flavin-dependent oxidoreductase [Ktedonobacteraceae bacterium]|nr:LLM class flavin-dependent oxidoreductase [Ktedonobacteraceae bacterium]
MRRNISFFVRVHQTNMTYQQLLTIWKAADRLGYDGASLYDLLAVPCLESWTVLTALTMATQRLLAIPLVLVHTYRHPAVLAKMAATLDVVSGGRLILGLGAGGSQRDHEACGIPWWSVQERLARLEDGINLLRFLWSGREGQLSSHYYGTLTGPGYPQPVQHPGPPILIGGHGEQYVLRTVARVADLCNIGFDLHPVQWGQYKETLERYASEEGRESAAVGFTHNATVILSRDPQAIRTRVEHYANSRGYSVANAWQRLEHALVGTPEQCVARLQAYVALGIRHFFLLFPDLPDVTSLELFARTVLPVFRQVHTLA